MVHIVIALWMMSQQDQHENVERAKKPKRKKKINFKSVIVFINHNPAIELSSCLTEGYITCSIYHQLYYLICFPGWPNKDLKDKTIYCSLWVMSLESIYYHVLSAKPSEISSYRRKEDRYLCLVCPWLENDRAFNLLPPCRWMALFFRWPKHPPRL